MRRLKVLALGVAGVVLPVILVFSAYLIASGSIGAAGSDVPPVPQNRVTSPQETPTSDDGVDDRGGRCNEAEHRNDPECVSESPSENPSESPSEEPDNSGPGSGDEPDDEDPDNSGPGSSNSGHGSGGGDD